MVTRRLLSQPYVTQVSSITTSSLFSWDLERRQKPLYYKVFTGYGTYNQNGILQSKISTQVIIATVFVQPSSFSLGLFLKDRSLPRGESGGARTLAGLADGPREFVGPARI